MTARMLTEATGKFAYQLEGEEYVASHDDAALQWGYSTGKTRVALTRVVRDDRIVYTLCFCRLDNIDTLRKEAVKHTTLDVVELAGANADVRTVVAEYSSRLSSQRSKTLFLLNYDKARYLEQELASLRAEAILIDESLNIKRWKAERTKAICRLGHAENVIFRCIMAGEFAPQDKTDYWAQFFFKDKGKALGKSFYWFSNDYFNQMGYDLILKPGARDRLLKVVSENCSILRTSDVRVPKRTAPRIVEVQPSKRQLSLLEQLSHGSIALPDGYVWVPNNPAVSFEKRLQICGGYMQCPPPPEGDGHIWVLQENPKLDALMELLGTEFADRKNFGNPKIIVIAYHNWEIDRISEEVGKAGWRYVQLRGTNTRVQNTQAKDAFLENPEVRLMVGQADMFVGLNDLITADTMIFYGNSHRVDSRNQAEMRLDRPGQLANILNFVDIVIHDQDDHAVALAVGYARMDVAGFTSAARLLQVARAKLAMDAPK